MSTPAVLEADIANNLAAYAVFASQAVSFHEQNALPAHLCYAADLALEELVTNILKYGYDDGDEHLIHIRLAYDGAELCLCICDDGHPFDPTRTPEPDLTLPVEQRPIGGLGISLVRKNFDSFFYRRENGRNCTELRLRDKTNGASA